MNETEDNLIKMDAMMKTVEEAMGDIVERLSIKYKFDKAEALDYMQRMNLLEKEEEKEQESDYEYLKYVATKETLRATIDLYGVAIIPNVLSEKECNAVVSGIWSFFEHITQSWFVPIKRSDEASWKGFYKLYPMHSMLVQHWGVGHAQVSWDLRQNEKIVEIFAHFWKCAPKDLLVSFDGLSFNLPPEVTKRGWNKQNTWYHTDQSYTENDFKCIQSWVTGLDVNHGDATLAIMEGSNKFHRECGELFQLKEKGNWYKLNKEQEAFYIAKGCTYKNIKCPKGALVFWDSRTIHCGVEAVKTRAQPNFRAIVYLCYMPRALCSAVNLKKKQKALEELRSTSHWPSKPKLFGKSPRTYGGELPVVTAVAKPVLSELGLRLAGC
jgi:hypothetical protein